MFVTISMHSRIESLPGRLLYPGVFGGGNIFSKPHIVAILAALVEKLVTTSFYMFIGGGK
jgi:hypothetical protein